MADVGLAKLAPSVEDGAASAISTAAVRGTPGLLDPLVTNGLHYSPLSDGYAFGVTLLVALTGMTAVGLRQKCRLMLRNPDRPDKWRAPGVPDTKAGEWGAVASALATVAAGLTEEFAEDRITMEDVLQQLDEVLVDEVWPTPTAVPSRVAQSPAPAEAPAPPPLPAPEPEGRLCVVCDDAPRTVRFVCGHACCCDNCAAAVASTDNLCPICRTPLGAELAHGSYVSGAPSFVLQTAGAAEGGRAGRGGRGGRGRGLQEGETGRGGRGGRGGVAPWESLLQ